MTKQLLLGNEAIARGAWEAGVSVISSYPGTPSTEITQAAAKYPEMYTEWATNEKVALEVVCGAAIAGARAMTCMKHVGLNVAADPLFTAAYTGIRAGLVLVVADDPAMFSSQNEQDSRFYARAAHVPCLEPSDSQEAKDMIIRAFDLSEQYDTPVIVRLTTRISHARTLVTLDERQEVATRPYEKDIKKYVMMPGFARLRHPVVEAREKQMSQDANTFPENRAEIRDTAVGVVTSSVCYAYVREALPNASIYKLGMTYPLPMDALKAFAQKVDKLVVIEELEPFLEDALKAAGIPCEGVQHTGLQGELSVERVRQALTGVPCDPAMPSKALPRPPVLCPGCPHRAAFDVIKRMKLTVFGDIGCYTLSAMPPLSTMDTTLCMGASIGMAFGAEKAQGRDFARQSIAVLGDSTFLHSGITALIDAVYNGGTITVLILDNAITGMTGHQHNPASGFEIHGLPAPQVSLEALCRACGVEDVQTVDPLDQALTKNALEHALSHDAVSVIIAKRPCVLLTGQRKPPLSIEGCRGCNRCLVIGCPALTKGDKTVTLNRGLCAGCGLCATLCPFGAIRKGATV